MPQTRNKMLYYLHMQPNTQQPSGDQQGFYRPTQQAPYQATQVADEEFLPTTQEYDDDEVVRWEASEYIHRSKDATWIIGFGIIVAIILGVALWLQAWTFAALVVVMAAAMGVFAFRKPKVKKYALSHHGLQIDDRVYHLSDFRSFGVLAEEAFFSIMLIPTKRFMPAVTVYFAQEDGEQIVGILSTHLPLEELQPDPIDAIMRRLHF
jgi:hypothetical protein